MMSNLKKGVWAALLSNILFGVLYLYSSWMRPMSGTDVFAWRMVSMLVGLWLILLLSRGWHDLFRFAYKVGRNWKKWLLIVLPMPILASQLWLFMWAPVNGYGVDVAMGYFLFPLVMVLCGRLFFGETLSRLQWLAVVLAAAGVAHELWQTHAFSWVSIWVFATYPMYYLLRRLLRVPALTGLLIDLSLIAPIALGYLLLQADGMAVWASPNRYWLLIPLMGIISAAAMQLNLHASRLLPVTLFGMFSYLEPVLLFVLAVLVLKAPLAAESLITYGLIWAALSLSLLDGRLKMRRPLPA
ncbi:chloramphenicol-sensitive protein RarD [Pasteurella testudinis DSM 23072]|uniref:Chloramphenicol-sensitive protein RarD n=1 Tax=Pasteurella testudinis DSM 23072 TaxID=1122938 RepID=A0A1W1V790_9PAST|nr:EamA family transporter RarD [Pasteurella testudinis]SMB89143.1 chloramphenicol-sensitive protein RarD [Pasteurella testudinis DSM 23072]SUB50191.1 putative transporter [Pasteurella testudinis]